MKNPNKIQDPTVDKVFYAVAYVILTIILIGAMYPIYFVLLASISDPTIVNSGKFLLYPEGITWIGYQKVFENSDIWLGYLNTIIYAVAGTAFGVAVSVLAGYSLSRNDLPFKGIVMFVFIFTMYFSGGLMPTYITIVGYNLVNTRLLMVILGSVTVYNIILIRSFFASSLPLELQESAFIDGCTNQRFFVSIVVPLSKPIIAVISLYIAVSHWNSYFNPMIYLSDESKKPLQLVLRKLLMQSTPSSTEIIDPEAQELLTKMAEVIKYGLIVVSTVPIVCVYPFIQKYFVQGVMIGSVKG